MTESIDAVDVRSRAECESGFLVVLYLGPLIFMLTGVVKLA